MNRITLSIALICLAFGWMGGCVTPKPVGDNNTHNPISPAPANNPMIHARDLKIVDGKNNPVKLRGVLLEGWLMWNGPLWGAGLTSETKISNRLEKMAGKEQTEKFRTAIYENFITEKDIQMISGLGFNAVRVPFNHTVLEDGSPVENYSAPGWKYLDNLIVWCERQKLYVVLDFHSLPGGQGAFVSDPDLVNVWYSPAHQARTVEIWGAIAKRYQNREIIAGYDLINEPDAPKGTDLVDLHRRIIKEIRSVDPFHMIILEGGQFASSDFTMYDGPLDANQAYSFHSYNLFADDSDEPSLIKLSQIAKAHNVPIWNGEFGAHHISWITEELRLFEDSQFQVNGWTFWPWKRVSENSDRYRQLGEILPSDEWRQVAGGIAALFGPSPEITPQIAKKGMDDFIQSSKAENLVFDEEMKQLLMENLGK